MIAPTIIRLLLTVFININPFLGFGVKCGAISPDPFFYSLNQIAQ